MADSVCLENIHDPIERVKALCKAGGHVDVDPTINTRLYFRSGRQMIKMAMVYFDEGSLQSAFILFTKFITLFVEKLPRHPDYNQSSKKDIKDIKKKLLDVFPIAEELKHKLRVIFTENEKKRQEEERRLQEQLALEQEQQRIEQEKRDRAEKERSEKLRIESEELWIQEQEEQFRQLQEREKEKLERDLAAVNISTDITPNNQTSKSGGAGYQQPIPNFVANDLSSHYATVPNRDLKKNLLADSNSFKSNTLPNVPSFDRSTKPSLNDSNPNLNDSLMSISGLESINKDLRSVLVPTDLIKKFLNTAQSNTDKNIETCGILAGKLSHNQFHITYVLIPKQSGTSETCITQNEEEIFDFQDTNDLLTLGWIHTHPSQTAFLSSVDLHTHCSYQLMLPEAIAIVCSPKYKETGLFTLTPGRGLPIISNCREKGFHMHPTEPPLFETGQHIKMVDSSTAMLKDFRKL